MFASYALRSLTDGGVRSAVFLVSGMDLISIVVVLIVAGVLLWLVQTYIPMPAPIKTRESGSEGDPGRREPCGSYRPTITKGGGVRSKWQI